MSVRNTCNRILCVSLTVISTSLAHSKKSIVWYVAIKLEGRLNGGKLDPSPRHAFRVTASSHVDVTTIVSDDQFETQFIVYIQRRYPIYNAHRRTNISYVKVRVHIIRMKIVLLVLCTFKVQRTKSTMGLTPKHQHEIMTYAISF